ncbi:uncharacterized protein LOC133529181 isoform X2 [Cydia pomonella]|uniref:uncharacterized protein LOC133529181 isoform X2 n=1 Tax=Cydia pomonella TaxID=82600 RepID=UPI002ADDCE56|nr:uncharacterized protein LOC133529181 isoform X2 [Cydia pomonella]
MAFYTKEMAENAEIMQAWRAGHGVSRERDEVINIPQICDEIGNLMRRERHPRKRLSLRSFSVLLSGTTRLYRDQVDSLLKDTFECSINPVSVPPTVDDTIAEPSDEELPESISNIDATNTIESPGEELPESNIDASNTIESPGEELPESNIDASNTIESPGEELPESNIDASNTIESPGEELPESNIDASNTIENNSPENRNVSEPMKYNTDTESLPSEDSNETIADDDSTVFTVTPNSKEQINSKEQDAAEKTRDQIETSPTASGTLTNFDPDLPFGYIIVHDNYHSRIPSKILVCNLSEDVKFVPFTDQ